MSSKDRQLIFKFHNLFALTEEIGYKLEQLRLSALIFVMYNKQLELDRRRERRREITKISFACRIWNSTLSSYLRIKILASPTDIYRNENRVARGSEREFLHSRMLILNNYPLQRYAIYEINMTIVLIIGSSSKFECLEEQETEKKQITLIMRSWR